MATGGYSVSRSFCFPSHNALLRTLLLVLPGIYQWKKTQTESTRPRLWSGHAMVTAPFRFSLYGVKQEVYEKAVCRFTNRNVTTLGILFFVWF